MKYKRYSDVKEFYNDTFSILLKNELQNTLPLGNVILGNKGGEPDGWRNTKNWYMSTITDDDNTVLLTVIMTPPYNITMYETDNLPNDEALICLCDNLISQNITVPGITSENKLAERFAKVYTQKTRIYYKMRKNLRIYKLEKLSEHIELFGKVRKAQKKDLSFLPYWYKGFNEDCSLGALSLKDAFIASERDIEKGLLYVLEDDGVPVSISAALREVVNGRCVGRVYTPPYFRKKGYACSCVAQVSEIVLNMGYKYSSLFTDLSNPVSNSIYQKIGYKTVCDNNELEFSNELSN